MPAAVVVGWVVSPKFRAPGRVDAGPAGAWQRGGGSGGGVSR